MDILHKKLITRILEGKGNATTDLRKSAYENSQLNEPLKSFIDKVAHGAYKVTDKDIAMLIESGTSENEIFELVICAAVGQSTRQYESALQALSEAENNKKPEGYAS